VVPTARSTGAHWHDPANDLVVRASYDAAAGEGWRVDQTPVLGTIGEDIHPPDPLYELLYSDRDQEVSGSNIAPFGRIPDGGSFEPSDNPIVIVLNMLLSRDGSRFTSGADQHSYDLDTHLGAGNYGLYPRYSLGVPLDQVDVPAFEAVMNSDLGDARARRLWIGGADQEEFEAVFRRLLGLYGYAVGTTRKGVWKILSIGDVYPGASTVTLDNTSITDAARIEMRVSGRALDSIVIETDPWPDGSNGVPVNISEVTGRTYYPRHVGSEETWPNSPYLAEDFGDDLTSYATIANRIRRLADRVYYVSLDLNAAQFDAVELGDSVTIHDLTIRSPITGLRLTSNDGALKGMVTDVRINWRKRTARVVVVVTNTPAGVALIAPSAKVISWDTDTATVESHEYTRSRTTDDTDARRFTVGDVCRLVNKAGGVVSGSGTAIVSGITDTTLIFAADSFDVDPSVDKRIVFAKYDETTADQRATYAHGADDLAGSTDHTLGAAGDDPYVYGD
jgi:hypothetical protein